MYLFLLILISAIGFGGWPTITRLAGATSPAWTNVILMSVTTTLMFLYYGRSLRTEPLTAHQGGAIVFAAALNSIALVLFGVLIQKYPGYVPVAQALMPVVSFLSAWKLLGAPVCKEQFVFLTITGIGIAGMGYFTPKQ